MGEAKRRGSLEQRQAEGAEKRERIARLRREMLARMESAMTPEQRSARRQTQLLLAAGLMSVTTMKGKQ